MARGEPTDRPPATAGRHRARPGHNPQTQEPMRISARRLPKFTAGKDLKKLIR